MTLIPHPNTLDITPHPRILQVFGDIEFNILQCICELIDNSIDGFLDSKRLGHEIGDPQITIATGQETVQVLDNGPGMTIARLERAVKAGWTSKNGTDSLGLYGMGFNIATAKLGGITRIWTTTAGDTQWHGLEIDLAKLAEREDFKLPLLTKPKSVPGDSGTTIEVTKLRPIWVGKMRGQWFKNNVIDKLSRIYKSMLRSNGAYPIHFRLVVNGKRVNAWEQVTWPDNRYITTSSTNEIIHAIEYFDIIFGTKYLSRTTGEYFNSLEGLESDDIIEVPERVHGWVGLQRYADEYDYGIDIIRNGRVIEMATKDLFYWEDDGGEKRKEYPIDDVRGRGRIVGEVHLDHGYVYYTKDKFERNRTSWTQLLKAVRNNEPLTHRGSNYSQQQNMSPLGKIYRAFRRNSPQRPKTYSSILALDDWEKAKQAAQKYRAGDLEYRNEDWWDKALEEADKKFAGPVATLAKSFDVTKMGTESTVNESATAEKTTDTDLSDIDRLATITLMPETTATPFSRKEPSQLPTSIRKLLPEYNLKVNGPLSSQSYEIRVYACPDSQGQQALSSRPTTRGIYEIDVNPDHVVFHSASFQVEDGVLAELAYYVTREESALAAAGQRVEFGDILANIREQHATRNSLEPNRLTIDIQGLLKKLQGLLNNQINEEEQEALLEQLPDDRIAKIRLAMSKHGKRKTVVDFFGFEDIATIVDKDVEKLLSKDILELPWNPVDISDNPAILSVYHDDLQRQVKSMMYAIISFAPTGDAPTSQASLLYTRAALNLFEEMLA